jgi:O-antigen/teichoic acid export membrane protein
MLGRHLLYYLPVNAAQAIVGFGGVYVLTRMLSPHDYGLYALALAATHFVHVPVFTWLEAAAARFHARADRRGRLADHFATLYAVFIPAALAFALVLGAVLWFAPLPAEVKTLAGFAGAALLARAALKIFLETRRAAHDAARYGVLESLYILGGFGLGIGLILVTPLRAAGPFAGMLVAALVCVVIEAPSMLRRARGGSPEIRRAIAYARYGGPVAIGLVMALVVSVSDRFLIAFFLGEEAAGIYSAAYGLADRTLDVIFLWVGMAAGPLAVSLLEREGRDSARASLRAQGETMILLALPAAVGLALVAGPLAAVMTGEAFRQQAAAIIPWIAAAGFLAGFTTYYLDTSLELARKTHLTIPILAVPAALNIVMNILLLPRFGIMGAVAATVAAYAIGAAITFLVGRRYFPLPMPVAAFLRTGGACAAMAVVVLSLPEFERAWLQLLVHAGGGAAVFALAALALDAGPARAFAAAGFLRLRPARVAEAAS